MKVIINEKLLLLLFWKIVLCLAVTQPEGKSHVVGEVGPGSLSVSGGNESLLLDFSHEVPHHPELIPFNPFMRVYLPVCVQDLVENENLCLF